MRFIRLRWRIEYLMRLSGFSHIIFALIVILLSFAFIYARPEKTDTFIPIIFLIVGHYFGREGSKDEKSDNDRK